MGGKKLPAEEVFSKALNKLVKSVMKMFERDTNLKGIDTKYIKWIITVPALWSEKSKKIIRTCAESVRFTKNICPFFWLNSIFITLSFLNQT